MIIFHKMCVYAQSLSLVGLFETPCTVAYQAPLFMGFPQQEYWEYKNTSKNTFPPPGNLPDAGIKPISPMSPALAGRCFATVPLRKPIS